MAVPSTSNAIYLTGNLAFLAGGVSVEHLYGAFVKSITVGGLATVQQADGSEATVQLTVSSDGGSSISSGAAFPSSPAANYLHVFRADVASGLDWKDTDGITDITAASAGDVALYDGTDWIRLGTLQSPEPASWAVDGNTDAIPAAKLTNAPESGTDYQTGTTFPSSPETDDLFEFNDSASITAKDYDGSADLTSAERGDLFKYNGANWVKQSESGSTSSTATSGANQDLSRSARVVLSSASIASSSVTGSANVRRRLGVLTGSEVRDRLINVELSGTFTNLDVNAAMAPVSITDNNTGAAVSNIRVVSESIDIVATSTANEYVFSANSFAVIEVLTNAETNIWLDVTLPSAPTTGTFAATASLIWHSLGIEQWAAFDLDVDIPVDKLPNIPEEKLPNIPIDKIPDIPVSKLPEESILPTYPASGSRDNRVPKFNGDTLGWEVDDTGTQYLTGGSFPASANTNDIFEFNAENTSITAKDYDGSANVTSADRGDVFKYDGTDWVKQSEIGLSSRDLEKIDRYDDNPAGNRIFATGPYQLLGAYTLLPYQAGDFTANNITVGQSMISPLSGTVRSFLVHLHPQDRGAVDVFRLALNTSADAVLLNDGATTEIFRGQVLAVIHRTGDVYMVRMSQATSSLPNTSTPIDVQVTSLVEAQINDVLPEFPAEGSRDNRVLKFNGNNLGWEADATGKAVNAQALDGTSIVDNIGAIRPGRGVLFESVSGVDDAISISLGARLSSDLTYCGVSTDTTIGASDVPSASVNAGDQLTIPTYTGARHIYALRPASIGSVQAVYIYSGSSAIGRNTYNQINSWQAIAAFDVNGVSYSGVVSTEALTGASGLMLEVI